MILLLDSVDSSKPESSVLIDKLKDEALLEFSSGGLMELLKELEQEL